MFVTFEGIDGSGKSTQLSRVASWVRAQGHHVIETRDPGGTEVSEQVRRLLLSSDVSLDARTELFLFAAARAQLVAEQIRPALQAGHAVFCDRFYDSTTAYQGGGRGAVPKEWLHSLHQHTTGGLVPDRTYLIDVPVAVAQTRRVQEVNDRMEQEQESFHKDVRSAYRALALDEPQRICMIDGTADVETITKQIQADIKQHWPAWATGTPQ